MKNAAKCRFLVRMPFFCDNIFFTQQKTRSDLQQYTSCILYQVLVSVRAAAARGSTYILHIYDVSM